MKRILYFLLFALLSVVANAQDVKRISILDKKVEEGVYDRVEMLRITMSKGSAYYVSFPCDIDGYYFGADARRYVVKNYKPKVVNNVVYVSLDDLEPMEDEADFSPNVKYVVVPQITTDKIIGLTAGVKTWVLETELSRDMSRMIGDMNSDFKVTVSDVVKMVDLLNGQKSLTATQVILTDADSNGKFTMSDVDKVAEQIVK